MTDIPSWFGKVEFYALLTTVWMFMFTWLLVNIIKVKQGINIKKNVTRLKDWWKKRKEEKIL